MKWQGGASSSKPKNDTKSAQTPEPARPVLSKQTVDSDLDEDEDKEEIREEKSDGSVDSEGDIETITSKRKANDPPINNSDVASKKNFSYAARYSTLEGC